MNTIERRIAFRKRLRGREALYGGWTSLGHPSITEMFCRVGFDYIGIDIEHSTISLEQSQAIITICQAAGIPCLPRIASHNPEMIKRLLDAGADGLIVPMVSTPAEVEALISWCKYPPLGKRSYGIARGQGYGFDFDDYVQSWNEGSSLIIQIESQEGVKNIDDLLAFDGVDGAMIGPYDLSGDMGVPGQITHDDIAAAARHVAEACKRHGKGCGTHLVEPDDAAFQQAQSLGHTFAAVDSDIFLMWKWGERMGDQLARVRSRQQG